MKYIALALCVMLAACAHRGDLKTPTQIKVQQEKAAAKAAKEGKEKEKKKPADAKPEEAVQPPAETEQE